MSQERKIADLKCAMELVNVLHKVVLLWSQSNRQEMLTLLKQKGFDQSKTFYRVTQANSETSVNENKEKKLLDGFLSGRERLKEDVKNVNKQGELFE